MVNLILDHQVTHTKIHNKSVFDKNTHLEDAICDQNISIQNAIKDNSVKHTQITSLQKILSGRIKQIKDLSKNEIVVKKMR